MKKHYDELADARKEYLKPNMKSRHVNLIDDLVLLAGVTLALTCFALLGLMLGIAFDQLLIQTVK